MHVCHLVFLAVITGSLQSEWEEKSVGQKVHSGFPVRCYGKTRTNFSANPTYVYTHTHTHTHTQRPIVSVIAYEVSRQDLAAA